MHLYQSSSGSGWRLLVVASSELEEVMEKVVVEVVVEVHMVVQVSMVQWRMEVEPMDKDDQGTEVGCTKFLLLILIFLISSISSRWSV